MKHHPYSDIWPLMSGKDFENLKADIKANGLRLPVLTYKDQVLDGRNRERACEALDIKVRYEPADVKRDIDALTLVVSLNEHRRHLSVEQRAFAAAKLANMMQGGKSVKVSAETFTISKDKDKKHHAVSRINAAKIMNVSVASTKRARAILDYGNDSDVTDVVTGKASLAAKCDELRPRRETKAKPQKRAKPGRPRKEEQPRVRLVANNPSPHPKYLKPHEVDPEFTGTPTEFVQLYGRVQTKTAEQFATDKFEAYAATIRTAARHLKSLPELPTIGPINWLRSPKPSDVAKMQEYLPVLEAMVAAAREMLDVAVAALSKKQAG